MGIFSLFYLKEYKLKHTDVALRDSSYFDQIYLLLTGLLERPKNIVAHQFTVFFRAKKIADAAEGIGPGLVTCKRKFGCYYPIEGK